MFKESKLEEEDPIQARSISSPLISDLVKTELNYYWVEDDGTFAALHK